MRQNHSENSNKFNYDSRGFWTSSYNLSSYSPYFIDFYNYRTLYNTPLIPELWAKKILSIPINNKLLKKNSKLVLSKYNLRQDTETYRKIIKRITQT